MAISKIILNGITQMDLTGDTVEASNLIAPNTAHGADGEAIVGTATQGITPTGTLNITANDTYDVTNYASAVVNVPSGGGSSWTKVAETSYQIQESTSTTDTVIGTIQTGRADLWTSAKMVYVRIRDTAGKRDGYLYGTDCIIYNVQPINGGTTTTYTTMIRSLITYYNSKYTVASSAYGVYVTQLTSAGDIRINKRYSSSISRKIGGTYKVEVYLLDPPAGTTIFE